MKKEMKKITRIFIMAMTLIMVVSVFTTPDEASAATAYTAKRVTNVKVASKTYNSVKLTWNKVSGTKYYQVYRATSKNGTYKRIATTKNNYVTNSKLTTGKYYYYKIRGYKVVSGKKKYTKYSSKIKTYARIATPTIKTTGSTSNVKITWSKPAGAQGYQIYRAVKGGTYSKLATVSATTVKSKGALYYDKSAEPGRTYNYKIRAYRKVGKSYKYSYFSSVKTGVKTLATPALTATANNSNRTVKLSWKAVSKATGYLVYRYDESAKKYVKIATTSSTSFTDTKRDFGVANKYYMKAYRTVSKVTNYSGNSSAKTATVTLSKPTLKVASSTSDSITLTWNQVAGATGYKVYAREGSVGSYKGISTISGATKTTATIKNLKPGVNYYFTVVGTAIQYKDNSTVTSAASNTVTVTIRVATPTLSLSANDEEGTITLTWNAVAGAEKYIIYKAANGGEYETLGNMETASFTDNDVERGVTYKYKIRATGGGTYSDYSNEVGGILKTDIIQPDAPAITVTEKEDADVPAAILTWDAVEGAEGYEVTRAVNEEAYGEAIMVTETSYEDSDIAIDNTYSYRVRAYKTVEETVYYSEYSNVVEFKLSTSGDGDTGESGDENKPVVGTCTCQAKSRAIQLIWDPIDGVDEYEVWRATELDGEYECIVDGLMSPNWYDNNLTPGQTYYYKIYAKGYTESVYTPNGTVPELTHDSVDQHDWKPVLEDGVEYTTEYYSSYQVCSNCYYSCRGGIYDHLDIDLWDDCGGFVSGGGFTVHKRVDTGEYATYVCGCGATRVFDLQ